MLCLIYLSDSSAVPLQCSAVSSSCSAAQSLLLARGSSKEDNKFEQSSPSAHSTLASAPTLTALSCQGCMSLPSTEPPDSSSHCQSCPLSKALQPGTPILADLGVTCSHMFAEHACCLFQEPVSLGSLLSPGCSNFFPGNRNIYPSS